VSLLYKRFHVNLVTSQTLKFALKRHKQTFGGRAPPDPLEERAGGAYSTCQTPSSCKREGEGLIKITINGNGTDRRDTEGQESGMKIGKRMRGKEGEGQVLPPYS
jgi:hypothetical protein